MKYNRRRSTADSRTLDRAQKTGTEGSATGRTSAEAARVKGYQEVFGEKTQKIAAARNTAAETEKLNLTGPTATQIQDEYQSVIDGYGGDKSKVPQNLRNYYEKQMTARQEAERTAGGFTLTPNAQIMVDVATRNLDRRRAHEYADRVTGRAQAQPAPVSIRTALQDAGNVRSVGDARTIAPQRRTQAQPAAETVQQPQVTADALRKQSEELYAKYDNAMAKYRQLYGAEAAQAEGVNIHATADSQYKTSSQALAAAKEYKRQADAISGQYYYTENAEKLRSVQSDKSTSALYGAAGDIQGDMDKVMAVMADAIDHTGGAEIAEYKDYLAEKYGLTQDAINQYAISGADGTAAQNGVYTNIYQLYTELEQAKKGKTDELSQSGYNYDRMQGYEQKLRDKAEYEKRAAETEQQAKEYPFLSSATTIPLSGLQGIDFLANAVRGIGHSDPRNLDTYVPLDNYNSEITNYVQGVRGTVSRELEESGGKVASFLYNTGMSVADSMAMMASVGSAATLFMGGSSASTTAQDVIQRGGTNSQAFWGGLAAGAAETLFEKVSVERLLTPRDVTGWKSWLKETLKQAGTEASEEALTEIANILSDAAIMGDSSQFATAVQNYRRSGMTETQAKQQAYLDCVGQVAWAGAGGLVSGTATGGTVNGVRGVTQTRGILSADTSLFDHGILKDLNAARTYLVNYAKANFPQTVVNQDTGREIGISNKGISKFLHGWLSYESYATGFHIPELVEQGVKTGQADNYHSEAANSIPTFEYYDSPIQVDGTDYIAHIRVKNTRMGDKYYGHTISEVEDIKIEPAMRTSSSQSDSVHPVYITGSTENSIPNSGGNVNGEQAMSNAEMLAEILAREPKPQTTSGFTLTPNAQIMVDVATRNLDRQRARAYADWVTGRGRFSNSGQAVPWYEHGPAPRTNTAPSMESHTARPMSNAEMLGEILAREPKPQTTSGFTLTPNAQIMVDVATRNLDRQRAHAYADWVTGRGQSGRDNIHTGINDTQDIIPRNAQAISNAEMLGEILARAEQPVEVGQGDRNIAEMRQQEDDELTANDSSSIISERPMAMGLRKPASHVLTDEEIKSIKEDAKALEMDETILSFNQGKRTGFADDEEVINIRGDILPDPESKIARDHMSQRAVLAHEYYGHCLHHPSEYAIGDWRDEFRASYEAAVKAPNLTGEDRMLLMIDAYDRAKEAGEYIPYDETARRIIYGF